jgi:DNA-binding CsgD family transcriptional regulator
MFREAVISILAVIAKQECVRAAQPRSSRRPHAVGLRLGRVPRARCSPTTVRSLNLKRNGKTIAQIAIELKVSRVTIYRTIRAAGEL